MNQRDRSKLYNEISGSRVSRCMCVLMSRQGKSYVRSIHGQNDKIKEGGESIGTQLNYCSREILEPCPTGQRVGSSGGWVPITTTIIWEWKNKQSGIFLPFSSLPNTLHLHPIIPIQPHCNQKSGTYPRSFILRKSMTTTAILLQSRGIFSWIKPPLTRSHMPPGLGVIIILIACISLPQSQSFRLLSLSGLMRKEEEKMVQLLSKVNQKSSFVFSFSIGRHMRIKKPEP